MTRTVQSKRADAESSESCVFPPLHQTPLKAVHWASVEAPQIVAKNIARISADSHQASHIILGALWAVILRRYVESAVTQMWQSGPTTQHGSERTHAEVMTVNFTDDTPFSRLLETAWWTNALPDLAEQPNTGIIVAPDVHPQTQHDQVVQKSLQQLSEICDILLVLCQSQYELRVVLSYRESTLLPMHACSILEQLQDMSTSICENTMQIVGDLWSMSGCDLRRMQRWNAHRSFQTTDYLMHEIIHRRALETPIKPAVESWDGILTYHQLDSLSSKLASRLMRRGIGPNVFVLISFHKSVWAIPAMLAVNKCGAAFVPVDPRVPSERLVRIMRQTDARVALACSKQSDALRKAGISVITVTGKIEQELREEPELELIYPGHAAPAYCLFTSGSTGEPKGCVVGHAAFAQTASCCKPYYLQSDSRVLQFASLGFGMALAEIFCTLSCGGTLCIPSDTSRMNSLTQAIADMNVNWALLSPTTVSTLSPTDLRGLTTIVLAGEAVQESHIADWSRHTRLLQSYGLTENSGPCTVSDPILSSDPSERTVGYPVNGRCWIVDPHDHRKLRGIGAVGELLIDTPSLAQGYLGDPERTALAFISPPPWIEQQVPARQSRPAVLYKTGDLARFSPDGRICHMGRKDHQVKVRGQRVEPGELEHHLRRLFPNVADVVVDVAIPTDANGVPSLAAFILQAEGHTSDDHILIESSEAFLEGVQSAKRSLDRIVPGYMIPTFFIRLGNMPKTTSGKKDRRRLRQEVSLLTCDELRSLTAAQHGRGQATDGLKSTAEQSLAQIWGDLLHLDPDQLGPDDDFLALGGDSVVAMRAVAMARVKGLELTVSDIFTTSKLREMAQSARLLDIASAPRLKPVHLVDDEAQNGCLAYLREHTSLLDSHMESPLILPASGMQKFFIDRSSFDYHVYILDGDLDLCRMQTACAAVVKKHSILRTFFTKHGHRIFQVVLQSLETPVNTITTAREVSAVAETFWSHPSSELLPLDLLPLRFILISNEDTKQHALVLRLSHAQYDGISLPTLIGDLAVAYDGGSLSPGPQFFDFIQYRSQQDPTAGHTFWRRYLDGSTITDPLDCKFNTLGGQKQPPTSDAVDAKALIPSTCEAPDGITMATLVKAAGALVLGELTQRHSLVLGQTVNGRSGLALAGLENILGPCLNFLPIRIDIQPTWTAAQYLRHVQEQHIQTTAYDYMELADIVENCTSWGSQTAFGVIFHHQNVDTNIKISLPGLRNTQTLSYLQQQMRSEVFVFSTAVEGGLEINIRAPAHILRVAEADELACKVAGRVQLLAGQPENSLESMTG